MFNVKFSKVTKGLLVSSVVATGLIGMATNASAHGYVSSPPSRAYQSQLDAQSLSWDAGLAAFGNVISQPQGLEAPKGYPTLGPLDGSIASANGVLDGGNIGSNKLDIQNSSQWTKQEIKTGINSFTWTYTATHPSTKWHYYMTKKGWDVNAPLNRDEMELIGTIQHDGSQAENNPTHKVDVPTDRSGYNVILAVWDVADTPNAFYQVIDVNVSDNGTTPTEPSESVTPDAPTELIAKTITTSSVELAWTAPTNTEIETYNVYRDGEKVKSMSTTSFTDTDLKANTDYSFTIEAVSFDGETSDMSAALDVKTKEVPVVDNEKPTAPSGVHSMGTTANSVSLMWNKSSHSVGVDSYSVYRDGVKIATVSGTMYNDTSLNASTTYTYTVKSTSLGGNVSDASTAFTITTADSIVTEGEFWQLGTFTAPTEYIAGEIVTHLGEKYKTLNTHLNYGDSNWAPGIALSLFEKI